MALSVVLFGAAASAAGAATGEARVTTFLDGLIGAWTGKAVTTPVGARPYDMTFKHLADGRIGAAAHPGRAVHYWWFYAANGRLHLTFLTTFQGNRTPRQFQPATFANDKAVFTTERADRLTVRVHLQRDKLAIDIHRHGRVHVAIRLTKQR